MNRKHVLWKLFVSTLYLSAFTFGAFPAGSIETACR